MNNLNLFKFSAILLDHDRCIDWRKEHNLLASSVKCQPKLRRPRHRCPHTGHWKYMVGSKARFTPNRNIQGTFRWLPTGLYVVSALRKGSLWKHHQAYRRPLWSPQRLNKGSFATVYTPLVIHFRYPGTKETKYLFTNGTNVMSSSIIFTRIMKEPLVTSTTGMIILFFNFRFANFTTMIALTLFYS